VNQVLQQLLLFLEQHLQRHRVRLETAFGEGLPDIEASAHQLQQVFLNLFNNACDAMPEGGTIRVETGVETDSGGRLFVVVRVRDTGIGIPKEKQEHIFKPFFSTKDLHRGTGLGLTIAARIIQQHQGSITLESREEGGTAFTIRFPAAASAAVKIAE
jgi:two-component system, NtrC family, sensor kinase